MSQARDFTLPPEPAPMRRLPPLRSILYSVSQFPPSQEGVRAEVRRLVEAGFAVPSVDVRYDPAIGHILECWGYRR